MIKTYCDICSREIRPGGFATSDLIRAKFFGYDEKNRIFGEALRELDLCTKCYKKIIRETKEMKEIAKTEKEPEKPAKAEKEKPKPLDPEEKKIDDGKIWALAHAKKPWTMEQIAEEMGIPKSTVYYHLKKMREERGEA